MKVRLTYKDPSYTIEDSLTEEQLERLREVSPGEYLSIEVDLETGKSCLINEDLEEASDNNEWMTVGHVPIKVKVDIGGNPHSALFMQNHAGEGTLGSGEEFLVGNNMAGGDLIVSIVEHPETYVVSTRDLMEVINKMWAAKKEEQL